MAETYFFELLNDLLSEGKNGIYSGRDLQEKVKPYHLSIRSIQRYRQGVIVPPFEGAEAIMNAFGIDISNADLKQILQNSRERRLQNLSMTRTTPVTQEKRSEGYGILVSKCDIKFIDVPEAEQFVKQRIYDLYGAEGNLRIYVANLVDQDIQKMMKERNIKNGN